MKTKISESSQKNPQSESLGSDLVSQITERRTKLALIEEGKSSAYPNDERPTHHTARILNEYGHYSREELEALPEPIRVHIAGRMLLKRVQGKASFSTIQDTTGKLQIYVNNQGVGEEKHEEFKHWDIGDIIAVTGTLFRTMRGEITISCEQIRLLVKSLRPLPDKFHGIADTELCYRQRYLDLIVNPDTRKCFISRGHLIRAIRNYFDEHGFLEVETPMLHPIPGGAAAKPFTTFHNALDQPMFLRIAPELYLKRLIVGGLEKIYEINRNFRNEGLSTRHNPEFTMLEFYAAYTDYLWMMSFTETLLRHLATMMHPSGIISYQGRIIDFNKPFARLSLCQAIMQQAPQYNLQSLQDTHFLHEEIARLGIKTQGTTLGALQLALFESVAESTLWEPTYLIDYPIEVSPLARRSDSNSEIAERFELFIAGREIANGFSELNDPREQSLRFLNQVHARENGDEEAMLFDADYIEALEYGMPPTGGCGIGIDRFIMLMTDSANIRDVVLFPALRTLKHSDPISFTPQDQ